MGNSVSSSLDPSFHIDIDSILLCVASAWEYQVSIVDSFISHASLVDDFCSIRNVVFSEVIMAKDVYDLCILQLAFLVLWDSDVKGGYSGSLVVQDV